MLGIPLVAEIRSYARPDTGFLLDAAGRVLDGARLSVDVVEINPPLVVGLNALSVLATRTLGVSEILVYRLGVMATLLGVLGLAALWLRRLLTEDVGLQRVFVLLLAFALFPLEGPDFGQREHLVLALLVPHVFLATTRSLGQAVAPGRDLPVNGYRRLGYIAYFSRDPEIQRILQEYQLVTQTRDYPWSTSSGRHPPVSGPVRRRHRCRAPVTSW